MQRKKRKFSVFILANSLLLANSAYAFDMGNMMNPSKWMGGNKNKDRYDENYADPGYGYPGGPPGYGYGGAPGYGQAPGSGYGSAPGYGAAPGYGYGGAPGYGQAPGSGYGGAPGYGQAPGSGYGGTPGYGTAPGYGGAPAYAAPGAESNEAEIMRLKERIRQLEGGVR